MSEKETRNRRERETDREIERDISKSNNLNRFVNYIRDCLIFIKI